MAESPSSKATTDQDKDVMINPRPIILEGTNITTKQYIGIIYNFIINVIQRSSFNVNKDIDMLRPGIPLTKIINYLDARSFLRLSATCQQLRYICFQSKAIKIQTEMFTIDFNTNFADHISLGVKATLKNFKKVEIYGLTLERIRRLPFKFSLSLVGKGMTLSATHLRRIEEYLQTFQYYNVHLISSEIKGTIEWTSVINMVKRYQVKSLNLWEAVPAHVHSNLLSLNLYELNITGGVVVNLLEDIKIPTVSIYDIALSIADVSTVMQMFLQKQFHIGCLCMYSSSFSQQDLLALFRSRFSNINSTQDRIPSARPLIVTHEEFPDFSFHWLITEENRIMEMTYMGREESFYFATTRFSPDFFPEFLSVFVNE